MKTVHLQDVPLNAGTLTLGDFRIQPGPPTDGNPFELDELMLTDRKELALFMPSADGISPGGLSWVMDDFQSGEMLLPGTQSNDSFGRNVRDAVSANIDDDAEDELVVLVSTGFTIELYSVDVAPSGSYDWTLLNTLGPVLLPFQFDCTLTVGDFDGDRRDEIAVFKTETSMFEVGSISTIYVLDDPVEGSGLLYQSWRGIDDSLGGHAYYEGTAADLDGDDDDELVIKRVGGDLGIATSYLQVFDWFDSSQDLRPISNQLRIHQDPNSGLFGSDCKVTAGQFDDDPDIELMVTSACPTALGTTTFKIALYQFNLNTGFLELIKEGRFSGPCYSGPALPFCYDTCAVDRFGDGNQELVLVRKLTTGRSNVRALRYLSGTDSWSSIELHSSTPTIDGDAVSVVPGDNEANGAEEVFVGYSWKSGNVNRTWIDVLEDGGSLTARRLPHNGTSPAPSNSPTRPLILAPGEFDGDGLQIRYTGVSRYTVSNPVPITLMAAVPTKNQISQNTLQSGTSYFTGAGNGFETSYTRSTTITAKSGYEFEDFTGSFGGSAKATMEAESRSTSTTANTVTTITGYSSAYDADTIIFAAEALLVHEYEVVNAPIFTAIGKRFTLDIPLGNRVYKWTVPYYNQRVGAPYRIGADLLPHVIGAPNSYRSFAEMLAVTSGVVSWRSPAATAVGQGNGYNSVTIELFNETTNSSQLEAAVGVEASMKAFGATVEGSISAGVGYGYSVATSNLTTYSGQVGDISDFNDYQRWDYDFGMYVYQAWRHADGNNQPTGTWDLGGYPLTVINFWTDPVGFGY